MPEVTSSIKTGIANAAIAPTVWWIGAQLYVSSKYIVPIPIRYIPAVMLLSLYQWNKVSEKSQAAIVEILPDAASVLKDNWKNFGRKGYKSIIKYGVNEIKISDHEYDKYKSLTRPVWDKMVGSMYSKEFLNKVIKTLKEYRENNNSLTTK